MLGAVSPSFFIQYQNTKCTGDPDETIEPHNYGFQQFQEIPIFSAHIWAWHHAGAWWSVTLKRKKKVDPLGGPNYSTANLKSKVPKYIQMLVSCC